MTPTSDNRATEYALTEDQASWLAGAVNLPPEVRREVLSAMLAREGPEAIVSAFAEFIGLANSVAENCADWLWLAGMVHGDLSAYEAEKLNCPTIFGALMGVKLARHGCEDACSGCAFRLGTAANQSPSTTTDADWCGHPGEQPFMCHEDLDDRGQPTKICQGWVRLRQARKREEA